MVRMRSSRRLFQRCLHLGHRRKFRFATKLIDYIRYARFCIFSLAYNSFTNSDVVIESLFEPVYWLVDHVTRWFGIVFVALVIVLTSSIVLIVYICVLPFIIHTYSTAWICWHVSYGHWNLIMIVFHYYKATTTPPGHPSQMETDIPSVSICRKCIAHKPARTHHCSICSRCVLKMDHHCPWLNNCVGHFNHRYFFSFCLFMTMGCIYCSISSRVMFREAYSAIEKMKLQEKERLQFAANETYNETPPPTFTFRERLFHKCIIYLWVLCSSVALALGALTLWHAMLITRGETSIERHINKKERKRQQLIGKVFYNPYSYGRCGNWKVFFGVERKLHWLTRVALPSSHLPFGNGLTWKAPPWILNKQPCVLAI